MHHKVKKIAEAHADDEDEKGTHFGVDEDGVPEMAVVEAMVANDALLFMAAEESENRTIIRSLREIGLEDAAQVI